MLTYVGDKPEQPIITISVLQNTQFNKENEHVYSGSANMFEAYHSSDNEDAEAEEPRDLYESLINLDTNTGQVELYDDQESEEENEDVPEILDSSNYLVLKPATDKTRMITIPKNNDYVNISEMLSRSFI